ncbi:MAG TPA: hypothetical protein VIM11_23655 [Tepidisphaeraceae bacterium]|jgi:DNA repair exonuclease SbcCD ATPase subunit
MAEKSTPKKRPPRQQMLEGLAETEKTVAARRESQAKPEEKIEARNVSQAVTVADELSTEGVVKSISELKSVVGKTLSQLSDRLEEQVARYVQIQRAIIAKEQELKEIYEIQRSASTLTALIETYERQRIELEAEHAALREELDEEIEKGRAEWEMEQKQREAEAKEREAAEQKRREREKEEYRYASAREQQQAKDRFADEMATAQKALAEQKAASERELSERERNVKAGETEVAGLRQRVEAFPKDLESAVAKAVKESTGRVQQDATAREELLKREFAGERNVLSTRIASLEKTVAEQNEQVARLLTQSEKAYGQVQEIAVRAIEGSANAKQLSNLQQMLADQARKGSER